MRGCFGALFGSVSGPDDGTFFPCERFFGTLSARHVLSSSSFQFDFFSLCSLTDDFFAYSSSRITTELFNTQWLPRSAPYRNRPPW